VPPLTRQQQRHPGRNKGDRRNAGHSAGEQQRGGVHADSLHTMHTPLANKNLSVHQTASSNTQDHMQAAVGFRPQYGRGRVDRAPPGLQQGVSHWRRSDRVTPELPPGLQHGATGQQQGSAGAGPKLPPGLQSGAGSSTARYTATYAVPWS